MPEKSQTPHWITTTEVRRRRSVNYENHDLQFHTSGSTSFGRTPAGYPMGCGFEGTGITYTGQVATFGSAPTPTAAIS